MGNQKPQRQRQDPQPNNRSEVPKSLDSERAVLGLILLEPASLDFVIEYGIGLDDFYSEAHRIAFQRMVDLAELARPIDFVTLTQAMQDDGVLEKAGGAGYVSALTDGVPIGTTEGLAEYCRIVKEKSTLRRMIVASENIVARCMSENKNAQEILDAGQQQFFDIAEERIKTKFVSMADAIKQSFGTIELMASGTRKLDGLETGFTDLDGMMGCFRNSELVVIAARPSIGKTTFALNICANASVRNLVPGGFFSLEMSKEQLVMRMLAAEARVDGFKMQTGMVARDDWPKLTSAMGRLAEAPLYFDDSASLTMAELRSKSRRLKAEKKIEYLMIDYLQLITGEGENRTQAVSSVSRGLKALSKELKIPVVALAQLNRAPELRRGLAKPQLSDLRESGSIEQDADAVLFLFRYPDSMDSEEEMPDGATVGLNIGKQRNGPVGDVNLVFLKRILRFENRVKEMGFYDGPRGTNDFEN
jgi:replicative DNA helicase